VFAEKEGLDLSFDRKVTSSWVPLEVKMALDANGQLIVLSDNDEGRYWPVFHIQSLGRLQTRRHMHIVLPCSNSVSLHETLTLIKRLATFTDRTFQGRKVWRRLRIEHLATFADRTFRGRDVNLLCCIFVGKKFHCFCCVSMPTTSFCAGLFRPSEALLRCLILNYFSNAFACPSCKRRDPSNRNE